MRRAIIACLSGVAILAVACGREAATPDSPPAAAAPAAEEQASPPQLANPASANCLKAGGRLSIEKNPSGAEFGVCLFEDNHQCEEWALLRGECPVGGRRITGYATQAGRYCAITGGTYAVTPGSGPNDERGSCTLSGGKPCEAEEYYRGLCGR